MLISRGRGCHVLSSCKLTVVSIWFTLSVQWGFYRGTRKNLPLARWNVVPKILQRQHLRQRVESLVIVTLMPQRHSIASTGVLLGKGGGLSTEPITKWSATQDSTSCSQHVWNWGCTSLNVYVYVKNLCAYSLCCFIIYASRFHSCHVKTACLKTTALGYVTISGETWLIKAMVRPSIHWAHKGATVWHVTFNLVRETGTKWSNIQIYIYIYKTGPSYLLPLTLNFKWTYMELLILGAKTADKMRIKLIICICVNGRLFNWLCRFPVFKYLCMLIWTENLPSPV